VTLLADSRADRSRRLGGLTDRPGASGPACSGCEPAAHPQYPAQRANTRIRSARSARCPTSAFVSVLIVVCGPAHQRPCGRAPERCKITISFASTLGEQRWSGSNFRPASACGSVFGHHVNARLGAEAIRLIFEASDQPLRLRGSLRTVPPPGESRAITQTIRNYAGSLGLAILGTILVSQLRFRITSSQIVQHLLVRVAAAHASIVSQSQSAGGTGAIPTSCGWTSRMQRARSSR
jgi:hypothetical protein